jgi:hypothetical protein
VHALQLVWQQTDEDLAGAGVRATAGKREHALADRQMLGRAWVVVEAAARAVAVALVALVRAADAELDEEVVHRTVQRHVLDIATVDHLQEAFGALL